MWLICWNKSTVTRDTISIAASISHLNSRSGGQTSSKVAMLTHVVEGSEWPLWGSGRALCMYIIPAECGSMGMETLSFDCEREYQGVS